MIIKIMSNLAIVGIFISCFSLDEVESLVETGHRDGEILYTPDFNNDSCKYDYTIDTGKNTVFFYNTNLYDLVFSVAEGDDAFLVAGDDLLDNPVFLSFKKNGPSGAFRLIGGELSGEKSSDDQWLVTAKNLVAHSGCHTEKYSFSNVVF